MGINAPYSDYVARLQDLRLSQGEEACAADQLLTLHDAAQANPNGTFLELGTDQGQATKVILNALHGHDGLLVSIDVEDCRTAGTGPNWKFIQSSSTDIDAILAAEPRLRAGIDLVYIDSLHTTAHVHGELHGWFPYVNQGGHLLIDDVDPTPYMRGHRKDSVKKELSNRSISTFIKETFYNNIKSLRLDIKLGSTGLAVLTKTAPLGACLAPYQPHTSPRTDRELAELHDSLRGHQPYKNHLAGHTMLVPLPDDDT